MEETRTGLSGTSSSVPSKTPRQLQAILDLLGIDDEADAVKGDKPERILSLLYRFLDILDAKTSYLLSFNSIIVAAQVFVAGATFQPIGGASKRAPAWMEIALFLFVLVPLFGTMEGMNVFRVEFRFLNWQQPSALRKDRREMEPAMWKEFCRLADICDQRYLANTRVWYVTLISAILLGLSVFSVAALIVLDRWTELWPILSSIK
jgi:hypothetical protein